jgi:hypothetical protein
MHYIKLITVVSPARYNQNNQVNEDEMGGGSGSHESEDECIEGFGRKNLKKEKIRKPYMQMER